MGRKKRNNQSGSSQKTNTGSVAAIDYDQLALAIVKAKQIEKESEKKRKEEALTKWKKEIGYNEHLEKKGLARKVLCFCNGFKVVWNIMFISRNKHIVTSPTSAFIQGLTAAFFHVTKWALAILAFVFVGVLFWHPNITYTFHDYFAGIVYAITSFMLSRVFRLMALEIEQMSNREQVLGIFTAVMSVLPLVDKVVGLFEG